MAALTRMIFALVLLVGLVGTAPAAADLTKVPEAVRKGGEYLRQVCSQANYRGGNHGLGSACICGMAMIEAGIKPNDPAIQNIVTLVRRGIFEDGAVYSTALAILFLDRLGEKRDEVLIQFLGVRLYAAQGSSGGWGYSTDLAAGPDIMQAVASGAGAAPPKAGTPPKPKFDDGFPVGMGKKETPAENPTNKLYPVIVPYFNAARAAAQGGRKGDIGDNSNTQFALIALWVAGRHGLVLDDAFALIEARFLNSQNPADGGWGYTLGMSASSTTAMTCAGVLGLAVGKARFNKAKSAPADPNPAGSDDPFFNPKKKDNAKAATPADRTKPNIDAGLRALGAVLKATPGGTGLMNYIGLGNEYYTIWSLERVAVVYGLDTIGDVDWYDWGCSYLLPQQTASGAFSDAHYGADVNTALAVLFMSKSNYVPDLSGNLKGSIKDPGKRELRGGGNAPPLFAPAKNDPGLGGGKPTLPPMDNDPPVGDANLPAVKGSNLATALAAATGDEFTTKLNYCRDTKGAEYTAALAKVIAKLDGARQKAARDALAERLTRMTAKTLTTMMADPDVELRRASCLAVAMKDDKVHIPDLIDRLTDPSDVVVRAAKASLKSLTQKDFGPAGGADDSAKAKAQADWRQWYAAEKKQ